MSPLAPVLRDALAASIQRAELMSKPDEFYVTAFGGCMPTLEEKLLWVEQNVQYLTSLQTFTNDTYFVRVEFCEPFYRLSVQRHDGQPCRNWRHLQQLKNELFGPRHEAVELYPAEDRLVDAGNEYHLWVHADPTYRFPLGFQKGRWVHESPAPGVALSGGNSLDSCGGVGSR